MNEISQDILSKFSTDDLRLVLGVIDKKIDFRGRLCKICLDFLPQDPCLEIYRVDDEFRITKRENSVSYICFKCVKISKEVYMSSLDVIRGDLFLYPRVSEIKPHREYIRALLNITELYEWISLI